LEGARLVEVGLAVVDALAQPAPVLLRHLVGRELLDVVVELLAIAVVVHRGAREADDRELLRQQPLALEVVERRDELALGQVAAGAEDHDRAGADALRVRARPGLDHVVHAFRARPRLRSLHWSDSFTASRNLASPAATSPPRWSRSARRPRS